jgi:hypothetical protein
MRPFAHILFTLTGLALAACSDDPGSLNQPRGYGAPASSSSGATGSTTTGTDTGSTSSGSSGSQGNTGPGSSGAAADAGADTGTSAASGPSSPEQICVDQINAYRKTVGSPALARWNAAESCSDGQAQSDSKTSSAHGAFGKCGEYGQNECPGWPGPSGEMIPDCLKMMWGEGPGGGHYENMKSTRYTKVSCGFYTLSDGSVWAVQNFQ